MFMKRLLATLLSVYCGLVSADDTELFVSDVSAENGIRPQVLIIFDNSGSMSTEEIVTSTPYDSSIDYTNGSNSNKIYWSTSSTIPSPSSSQYLYVNENNCNASIDPLERTGIYNGNVHRWSSYSQIWKKLSSNSGSIFDCKEDVTNLDPSNPGTNNGSGYPKDGNTGPYSSVTGPNAFYNYSVTLYSANYVYWSQNNDATEMSRLEIAQRAIVNLIESAPSVDFGLLVFNHNDGDSHDDKNGGRIVDKVMLRDSDESQALINKINDLDAETWTPLCESMYEAYRYYTGGGVYFGNDESGATPGRDTRADSNGVYLSPFKTCQEEAYIILMTDGQPTYDGAANAKILALTGNGAVEGSYMPSLTEWMSTTDIDNDADNGIQHIKTYTIGFGQDAVDDAGRLLAATALRGGGEYYPAANAADLQSAFQETILDILNSASSLSSPAISSNNFDRTRSLDSIYYSMFLPSDLPVWQGNIKKLTINSEGILVDRLGQAAIDEEGNIKETASTYWGGSGDGNTVTEGGVSAMLDAVTSRNVLSNIDGSTLKEPNIANLKAFYGVSTDADVAAELNLQESELANTLSWLVGIDVDDEDADNSTTDYRRGIFADPLHSQPLGITYTEDDKNIVRLLVGTNAGFLHMFTDNEGNGSDSVTENWAFIPEELLAAGASLRNAEPSGEHQYGMDLSPIAIKVLDTDGSISQIIAVVGMRRGGSSYYAIDITSPDSPSLLWKIDADNDDFSGLAQTWSVPVSGTFAYKSGGQTVVTPGLVFGAGYDTKKDNCIPSETETCDDVAGRGIFIVNALTGSKIWSTGNETCDEDDTHCMRDSIPSEIGLLDSDSDGYVDRLYSGDTGGNIWRMDLVGTDTSKWTTVKIAALGGDSATEDRRFFAPPVIVRTYKNDVTKVDTDSFTYSSVPYDGLLIGSGDRTRPASSIDVNNYYFSVQDYVVAPVLFGETGYLAKPTPKTIADLYSIDSDPIGSYSGEQVLNVHAELSDYSGWKYALAGIGEKSLGQGSVLEGASYFTSFVPNSTVNIDCGVGDFGVGWLYAVDLHTGEKVLSDHYDSDDSDGSDLVAKIEIGARVPDNLVAHSGLGTQGESVMRLLGVGQGQQQTVYNEETGEEETVYMGTMDTDADMMPRRIYSYFKEH